MATSTITRRFGQNFLGFGYVQLVTVAAQLVQVPFFLHYWGVAYYGEWLVLTGIPQLLVMLDFGVGQAAGNRAIMAAGSRNAEGVVAALHTAQAFTLTVSAFIVAAALAQFSFIDWTAVLKLSKVDRHEAAAAMLCMLVYLSVSILSSPLAACFRAIDRTPFGTLLLANKRVAEIVVSIVVLTNGGGFLKLAIALAVTQVTSTLGIALVLVRMAQIPVLGIHRSCKRELVALWKPSLASLGIPMAQTITLQGGLQVLNHFGSPALVVIYSMARTLVRLIIQMGMTACHALMPEVSRRCGAGDEATAEAIVLRVTRYTRTLAAIIYLLLVLVGSRIAQAWSGGGVSIAWWIFAVLGLHAVLNVWWYVPAASVIATNRHASIGMTYALSSAFALVAWLALGSKIDPIIGGSLLLAIPELCVAFVLWTQKRMHSGGA